MKKYLITLTAAASILIAGFVAQAQTAPMLSIASIEALLTNGVITIGSPFTIQGQTFTVLTNPTGNFVIYTSGPGGTATVTPPTTLTDAATKAEQMLAANNPTNASYYGTNELVGRLGAAYLQNSGQAVVEIGVEKYGLFSFISPQLGIGGAVFQGQNAGMSGTAGGVGFIDYRKIIGDVSAQVGIGGGYDNWNKSFMGVAKFDIELRQNKNIGEYVGVAYALEPSHLSGAQEKGGLIVRGGMNFSFANFNFLGL
jgi:hypothetical protein